MLLLALEQQKTLDIEEAARCFAPCAQGQWYCTPVWPRLTLLWEVWGYSPHEPLCSGAAFKPKLVPSVLAWAVLWCALVWTEPDLHVWGGDLTLDLPHHYELMHQCGLSGEPSCYRTCPAHCAWGLGPAWRGSASCIVGFGSLFPLKQAAFSAPWQ